ncbi:hypothetical protein [uncultured Litoreibacter sp.]|uniref:hypothetical protein n=1 Tax=uncultured Litoreibacter sp. TaxID=1392394 RepID=UPI002639D5C9|nr:hypothetical protein [uncultured Litoreibacter sp.]
MSIEFFFINSDAAIAVGEVAFGPTYPALNSDKTWVHTNFAFTAFSLGADRRCLKYFDLGCYHLVESGLSGIDISDLSFQRNYLECTLDCSISKAVVAKEVTREASLRLVSRYRAEGNTLAGAAALAATATADQGIKKTLKGSSLEKLFPKWDSDLKFPKSDLQVTSQMKDEVSALIVKNAHRLGSRR